MASNQAAWSRRCLNCRTNSALDRLHRKIGGNQSSIKWAGRTFKKRVYYTIRWSYNCKASATLSIMVCYESSTMAIHTRNALRGVLIWIFIKFEINSSEQINSQDLETSRFCGIKFLPFNSKGFKLKIWTQKRFWFNERGRTYSKNIKNSSLFTFDSYKTIFFSIK